MRPEVSSEGPHVLVLCLGNPGSDYAGTRHNAGFMFADWLAGEGDFGGFGRMNGVNARVARGTLAEMPALLVKPMTSMNDCGRVVPALQERYPMEHHMWAIVHDDLDVSLGSTKGRAKGGHGGHNGVRSILSATGRRDIVRVKIGVNSRRKRDYDSAADFLLSEFSRKERETLEGVFPEAAQILIGQVKSFAADLQKQDRRRDVTRAYAEDLLEEARAELNGLSACSPYPVFLDGQRMQRVRDVVIALAKLLRKARIVAAEDDQFHRRLVGYIPDELHPLVSERKASQRLFMAIDFHLSEEGTRVIELNAAPGYGHYAALADEALWPLVAGGAGGLSRPGRQDFAAFLYEHGLKPRHAPEAGALAFLRGFNDEDMFNVDELEGIAARIEERGGPHVGLCHEADLDLREDGLYLPETGRVDLLYVEENLADWAGLAEDSPLPRAVREGLLKVFPPPEMFLLSSKGFLAELCDPEVQQRLDPDDEQQKVLRRNVLWSQPLDRRVEPAAYYMLEQGLPLVVKEALGGGGRGVTILRPDSSSQQTGHILRRRMLDGRNVVQGYFEAGRWAAGSELRFDLRVLVAAHRGDIAVGPVYGRVFRGDKLGFSEPDTGVAPVYVVG